MDRFPHICDTPNSIPDCLLVRFAYKSTVIGECFVYTGQPKASFNRPLTRYRNKQVTIAKAAYIHSGFKVRGLDVCHTCDNPRCWNIKHLYSGTTKQNMRDRFERWDAFQGENHPKRKYKDAEYHQMKTLYDQGVRIIDIARIYGIRGSTVSCCLSSKILKEILT